VCDDPLDEDEISNVASHNLSCTRHRRPQEIIGYRCHRCRAITRSSMLLIRALARIAAAAERIALFNDDDEDEDAEGESETRSNGGHGENGAR
jgi:hypothetical protein